MSRGEGCWALLMTAQISIRRHEAAIMVKRKTNNHRRVILAQMSLPTLNISNNQPKSQLIHLHQIHSHPSFFLRFSCSSHSLSSSLLLSNSSLTLPFSSISLIFSWFLQAWQFCRASPLRNNGVSLKTDLTPSLQLPHPYILPSSHGSSCDSAVSKALHPDVLQVNHLYWTSAHMVAVEVGWVVLKMSRAKAVNFKLRIGGYRTTWSVAFEVFGGWNIEWHQAKVVFLLVYLYWDAAGSVDFTHFQVSHINVAYGSTLSYPNLAFTWPLLVLDSSFWRSSSESTSCNVVHWTLPFTCFKVSTCKHSTFYVSTVERNQAQQ